MANELVNTGEKRPVSEILRGLAAFVGVSEEGFSQYAEDLIGGMSENTKTMYFSIFKNYRAKGGHFPATPEQIAEYIRAMPNKVAGIAITLSAIAFFHRVMGFDDPTKSMIVEAAMRRIRRERGTAQELARPLTQENIIAVCKMLRDGAGRFTGGKRDKPKHLRDARDMALILVGFTGAFRESELVGIQVEDLQFALDWVVIKIPRSKTDQEGQGQFKLLFRATGNTGLCPVKSLEDWLNVSKIKSGYVFRGINHDGEIKDTGMTKRQIDNIVQYLAVRAGIPDLEPGNNLFKLRPKFSGHSLRAGFVTTCMSRGIPAWQIQRITLQTTDAMINKYNRPTQLAQDNPTAGLW